MNKQQQTLQKRFPLFTGLALFICFVLFPLFLVDTALNRVLQIQYEKSLDKTRKQLDSALNTLEGLSNNKNFVHALLSHAFKKSLNSTNPRASLQKQLEFLKQQYPGKFLFVVWDDKGQIIPEITDEKSFTYILREVYKLLNDLAENCRLYYPGAPEKIPDFNRRLNMVRNYIGRMVSRRSIQRPLQSERIASSILAEAKGAKANLWYAVDHRLSIMAFIHIDFFADNHGLEYAAKKLQTLNPGLKAGYTRYPIDPDTIFQYDSETEPVDIAIAVSRFENLYPSNVLNYSDMLFSFRYISPTIRAFCYFPQNIVASVAHSKRQLIGKTVKWLVILGFLLWVAAKKYQISHIPARLKLSALFLYAAGIPVLIIFIIGADYLQQKRKELIYDAQSRGLEQLRQIDDGFVDFLKQTAANARRYLQIHIDHDLPLAAQQATIAKFRAIVKRKFAPDSLMLFDYAGRNQMNSTGNQPFPDPAAISRVSKYTIEFFNRTDTDAYNITPIARSMAIDFDYRSQFIQNFSLGTNATYALFSATGRQQNYAFSGIFYLFWQMENLQKQYLEKVVSTNRYLSAYFPETDRFIRKSGRPDRPFASLMHKAASLLVLRSDEVIDHSQTFIASAIRGNHLHKSCLGIVIPFAEIDKEMRRLYKRFFVLSAIFLFFCGGGIILMRQRLLAPLRLFREAIEAIGQRNFRYQTEMPGNNEFGQLSQTLAHTLEHLSELEIARIVQKNLLPGREYRQNRVELMATLTQMSNIGGDYYDFFAVNSEQSGVFIGDVSGHGISSALVMAMARSAMIFENFHEPEQLHLMQTINNVIYQMRKSGAKDYMSGLSLFINSKTGEFRLLNAGHCPPIIVREATGKTEQQKCIGLYFGFNREFTAQPLSGKLEAGDLMVLYTDSWVESTSKSGIPFGFARFEQALLNCRDQNLDNYAKRMYATIETWEATRDDDMTLLLIKFGAEHES